MASITKILVISNREQSSLIWSSSLSQEFNLIFETNPAKCLQRWAETLPHLIILALESESLAIELVTKLRDETVIPILLVSSISSDKFMMDVYQAGVDDYILKPVHPALFISKLKAWLRHSWSVPAGVLDPLRIDDIRLVPAERRLMFVNRAPIHLTNLELHLLYTLMRWPGHTVTTEELCQRIWGGGREEDVISLKNVVYRLRRKIEFNPANPHYLVTVSGIGYQFKAK